MVSYCRAVSQMGLLMADYLVSEGGSTAQFLTTIVAVSVLLPEISETWRMRNYTGLTGQHWYSVTPSTNYSEIKHEEDIFSCMFHVPQSRTFVILQILSLKALYVRWKPQPKIFIASVLQNLYDHKLDFNHSFYVLETTQQKLQLLN